MAIEDELERSRVIGEELEQLVLERGQVPGEDRTILLMGYWSLLFDLHKGILLLIAARFHGSAFALVRPSIEALIRAHVAVEGSAEEVEKLRNDSYRTNFIVIGPWIDREFGTENLFTTMLRKAREVLHSYTHAGISQLGRRFTGHDLLPAYKEGEIIEVIRLSTSVSWMATNLVTKYLGFAEEAAKAEELFLAWGER